MTKKDYKLIADAIRDSKSLKEFIVLIKIRLKLDNSRFDKQKFDKYLNRDRK